MTQQVSPADLRKLRKDAGLPQQQVADTLGVTQDQVSRFERYGVPLPYGKSPEDYLAAINRITAEKAAR